MNEHIAWTNELPAHKYITVVAVGLNSISEIIAAGPVVAVYTHWIDGESRPCMSVGVPCPWCEPPPGVKRQARRWKGYMPAYTLRGRPVVHEVTAGAMRAVPEMAMPVIMGRRLTFTRRGVKRQSRVAVELRDDPARQGVVGFDVKPIILRMWGLADQEIEP